MIHVGTAGWTIPRDAAARFPPDGSALERYAARFSAVEINERWCMFDNTASSAATADALALAAVLEA